MTPSISSVAWYSIPAPLLWPLLPAVCMLAAGIWLALLHRYTTATWFLAAFALLAGVFAASLDPYLNLWDEQFHALVARNLALDPFKPMLYTETPYQVRPGMWTHGTIWLHKQPLFLWQMALFIKVLGPSVWAVRLPSVLLFSLMPLMVFSMGRFFANARVGWIAALLSSTSFFVYELISGRFATDHNDVVFLVYTTASLWAFTRYLKKPAWQNAVLVGVLAGAAVMVKWLPGLLVFAGWGAWLLAGRHRVVARLWWHVALAFAVSVVLVVPWQVYTLMAFPTEARFELEYNSRHFNEVIEGHGGGWFFHFKALEDLYGSGDAMIAVVLAAIVLFPLLVRRTEVVAPLAWVVVPYVVFTLAATKMKAFCLPAAPVVWMSLAVVIDRLLSLVPDTNRRWLKGPKLLGGLAVWLTVAFLMFNLNEMARVRFLPDSPELAARLKQQQLLTAIDAMKQAWAGNNRVLVFTNFRLQAPGLSFYAGCNVYGYVPSKTQVEQFLSDGKQVWFINGGTLPDYLAQNQEVKVVNVE
ncbi:MAG: glycosyltransferase family 39 protein [Bacteroidales bacterium]|nr:glycosyltransferase family 39 protein [Bacteroidales bacterium]MDD3665805.1 glycosyltransferase family 39 protein [Bacteroidales bacterium]